MIHTVAYSFCVLFWGLSHDYKYLVCFSLSIRQHPFITNAKPVTILRDLITEAMEMKAKRQQEQQRELEEDDENSVR